MIFKAIPNSIFIAVYGPLLADTVPDDRFFDGTETRKALQTDCEPVETERLFGDLLLLVKVEGRSLHMCVYVADDVVFTKNGVSVYQPSILSRISDTVDRYRYEKPARILTFRRKAN